jgi:hypothetical protein
MDDVSFPYKSATAYRIADLAVLMSQIAADYSVQFIDLNLLSGFNLQTISALTSDGLHPNSAGAEILGNIISNAFISSNSTGVDRRLGSHSGTWVPTLTDSGGGASYTFTVDRATYIRQGTKVEISVKISSIEQTGSKTGTLEIGGLPFTAIYDTPLNFARLTRFGVNYYSGWLQLYENSGDPWIEIVGQTTLDDSNTSALAGAVTNAVISFSGWYETNDQ